MNKIFKEVLEYVAIIVFVIVVRTYLVTPAIVDGASMDTTLEDGQLVIINKLVYRLNDIKRFDIVVVKNNEDHDKIIKRIIGLPNEKITYKENKLYINDEEVETDFECTYTDDFEMTTKDGEYLVLGDNRIVSKDSRILGNFKKKDILGRVKYRLFPFSKFGKIER